MTYKRILVFSSSRVGGGSFLQAAVPIIKNFLGPGKLNILFLPFASVERPYPEYLTIVSSALADIPRQIEILEPANAKAQLAGADVIMVGGGNTFKLLHDLYELKLLDIIRDKVDKGTPFIGWSAGANITCPTIGTTNDMPVISPKSLNALGLFPFQINPHYTNLQLEGHYGETRDDRIKEFLLLNPGIPVVGLPEGSVLKMDVGVLTYMGNSNGILFYHETNGCTAQREIQANEDLSFLL